MDYSPLIARLRAMANGRPPEGAAGLPLESPTRGAIVLTRLRRDLPPSESRRELLDDMSGPNHISLREGRKSFLRRGACDDRAMKHVRRPTAEELQLRRFDDDGNELAGWSGAVARPAERLAPAWLAVGRGHREGLARRVRRRHPRTSAARTRMPSFPPEALHPPEVLPLLPLSPASGPVPLTPASGIGAAAESTRSTHAK